MKQKINTENLNDKHNVHPIQFSNSNDYRDTGYLQNENYSDLPEIKCNLSCPQSNNYYYSGQENPHINLINEENIKPPQCYHAPWTSGAISNSTNKVEQSAEKRSRNATILRRERCKVPISNDQYRNQLLSHYVSENRNEGVSAFCSPCHNPEYYELEYFTDKSLKEKKFLSSLREVDPERSLAMSKMLSVPLPLLERLDCDTMPRKRAFSTKAHKAKQKIKFCDLPDLNCFLKNFHFAFLNCYDGIKALFLPIGCCNSECRSDKCCHNCGFTVKFCPECGCPHDPVFIKRPQDKPIIYEKIGDRCCLDDDNGHYSYFNDDFGEFCRGAGERIDKVVDSIMKACIGCLPSIPRLPFPREEGYSMYEPDFNLILKEKPTTTSGSCCVDTVNALLDKCCVEKRMHWIDYGTPQIAETEKTGNWFIDKVNEFLDDCCAENQSRSAILPPPSRSLCDSLFTNFNLNLDCFLEPQLSQTSTSEFRCFSKLCQDNKSRCPTCHQQIMMRKLEEKKSCDLSKLCSEPACSLDNNPQMRDSLVRKFRPEDFKTADYKCCLDCHDPSGPVNSAIVQKIQPRPIGFVKVLETIPQEVGITSNPSERKILTNNRNVVRNFNATEGAIVRENVEHKQTMPPIYLEPDSSAPIRTSKKKGCEFVPQISSSENQERRYQASPYTCCVAECTAC